MRIDIMTLFPDTVGDVLSESILGRAQERGILRIETHQIRDYTANRQNQVDDYPYGGGHGAVLQADPLYRCWCHVCDEAGAPVHTIYLSPAGHVFDQSDARRLAKMDNLVFVCGHYEGIDQRFIDECVDEELSIGDFVVTGGEIPAMAITDAVCRLVPGVLSDAACFEDESHWAGTLEYPQYSRPAEWHGLRVPDILLSGDHAKVARWRRKQSILRTRERRPDLYDAWCETHPLTELPKWKRGENMRLVKAEDQMARAAELFAEGRRTVCAPVCTGEQLAEMTPDSWRPELDAEKKNGWAFYLHYNKAGEADAMVGVCHKTGCIGHLFVTESARGQGIGTKLLDFARKKLPKHAHPTLDVLSTNTRAISLYKRMGWRLDGVLTTYDPAQGAPFAVYCEELRMRYRG